MIYAALALSAFFGLAAAAPPPLEETETPARSWSDLAIAPGRQSKLIFTTSVMASGVRAPFSVPYVSTNRESGLATPMAYESCTSARFERPLFTTDFAICRQMYAAERSTFVGSLPENAPPPCAPQPP